MRKITAVFIAITMLILVGCSAIQPSQTPQPDTQAQDTATEEIAAENEPTTSQEDEAEQQTDEDSPQEIIPFGDIAEFDTTTVANEKISEDVFKDYKLTMVNIWETWCPPCVAEMPHLQSVYEQLPEGANMLTIAGDASSERELAENILSEAGATFDSIVLNYSLYASIYPNITAFPTTIFLDSEGNLVGDPIIGVPQGDDVADAYLEQIEERLQTL